MLQAYEHVIRIIIKLSRYLPIICACIYTHTYIHAHMCGCIAVKISALLSSAGYTFDEAIKSRHGESGCCYWILKSQHLPLSSFFLHLLVCFWTTEYSIVSSFLQPTSDAPECMEKVIQHNGPSNKMERIIKFQSKRDVLLPVQPHIPFSSQIISHLKTINWRKN